MPQPKLNVDQLNLTDAPLMGDSTATTPSAADDDTSIATTAFVKAQNYAPTLSPSFTGNPTAPTQTTGNNSTRLATTAFVQDAISGLGGGAPTTNEVLTATAGASAGAVGTYAFLRRATTGATVGMGGTVSGGLLFSTNAAANTSGGAQSGTWMCVGYSVANASFQDTATVWLRIS